MIEESVAAIIKTQIYKSFPPVGMPMSFFHFFLATKQHDYCSKLFCSSGSNNSVIEESVARHDILVAFCADPDLVIGN